LKIHRRGKYHPWFRATIREEVRMGTAISLILIAVGAILTWAVTDTTDAVNLSAVGVILMVVGIVGLLLDLLLWSSWGPGYMRRRRTVAEGPPVEYERRVVEEPAPAARRRVVQDEEITSDAPPGPPPA
jgi:hypothetical protein